MTSTTVNLLRALARIAVEDAAAEGPHTQMLVPDARASAGGPHLAAAAPPSPCQPPRGRSGCAFGRSPGGVGQ